MDISRWKILNSELLVHNTRKLFFNQYLYRVKFESHNVRMALSPHTDTEMKEKYKKYEVYVKKVYDYKNMPSYSGTIKHAMENTKFDNLLSWNRFFRNYGYIKYRIEDPCISLYTSDLDSLYEIINKDKHLRNTVVSISKPESEKALKSLQEGKVLVKRIEGFTHIIYISDNWSLDVDDRVKVLEYLRSLGKNEVRIPLSTEKALMNKWAAGGYFYCKDPSISTCLSLICVGVVKNIFELEKVT